MSKTQRHPDQQPMSFMLPSTDWTVPTELPDWRGRGVIAADAETRDDGLGSGRGPGWVYGAGHIVGVSMASGNESIYVPVAHPDTENFDEGQVRRWLADHMAGSDRIVFHNAAYDLGWFSAQWSIPPPENLDDTLAMSYILDEDRRENNLDAVARWQGVPGKDETLLRQAADAYSTDPKAGLWRLPARYVGTYAAQDSVATLRLLERMEPQLDAQDLLPAYRLECDLIPMVLEMRRRGIRIDTKRVEQVRDQLLSLREETLAELSGNLAIGRDVTADDLRSTNMMKGLFQNEGIRYPQTAKGNPSFSTDWMEKMDHWLPTMATRVLKLTDAADKFIGNYIMEYTHLGRIHAEIHQFRDERGGTRTSRFSYSDPPLQQMPSRDPLIAKLIRSAFLPEKGEIWGALDYSQQEFRLMVHFADACGIDGVEEAVQRYRDDPDTDFHQLASDLTRLPRRAAKDVNFAKAFGAGKVKFAQMTGMSIDEATTTMKQYDEELPFIAGLSQFCQARAARRGFIRMIDGARARFEKWEPRWVDWEKQREHMAKVDWYDMPVGSCSLEEARERVTDPRHYWYHEKLQRAHTHKAMNYLIQGSAARQTKLAMRECWRAGIVPMLQMHDELSASFSSPEPARLMAEAMRDVVKLAVPVMVDAEFGVNWGEAKASDGYGATYKEAAALVAAASGGT